VPAHSIKYHAGVSLEVCEHLNHCVSQLPLRKAAGTIHNSQVMEIAKMPHTEEWIKKMWLSIHNGILCSHEEQNVIIRW
jgi:hypothetical protein